MAVPEYPAGEFVIIAEPKTCDVHWFTSQKTVPAVYDAKTQMGPWANLCQEHFERFGMGLGLGLGQRLILQSTVSESEKVTLPSTEGLLASMGLDTSDGEVS